MKARVLWEIDVEVDGGVMGCAQDALDAIREEGSTATVFIVIPEGGEETPKEVDLLEGTICDSTPSCVLALSELNEAGELSGAKTHTQVSSTALGDILSHARQLGVLAKRRGTQDPNVESCIAELAEALETAGL